MSGSFWFRNVIFYQALVGSFKDTTGSGVGTLRGVIDKLDYLKWLGVDCLWLSPFYASPMRDDGYDIRSAAVNVGVPCVTTVQGAVAAVQGIEALKDHETGVTAIQDIGETTAACIYEFFRHESNEKILQELTADGRSLEEVFLELTGGETEESTGEEDE